MLIAAAAAAYADAANSFLERGYSARHVTLSASANGRRRACCSRSQKERHVSVPRRLHIWCPPLHPPASPCSRNCSRTFHHTIFSEGEFEEVAGQEEGSVKRVRQVMLHIRISICHQLHFISFHFISFDSYLNRSIRDATQCFLCNAGVWPLHSCQRQRVRPHSFPQFNAHLTASVLLLPSIQRARNCQCAGTRASG